MCSRVQSAAVAALAEKSSTLSLSITTRSWFPIRQRSHVSRGRARDFRPTQGVLGIGGMAPDGGVLTLRVLPPPRAVRSGLEGAAARPLAGAAAAGAGLTLGLTVLALPVSAAAHRRSRGVGL